MSDTIPYRTMTHADRLRMAHTENNVKVQRKGLAFMFQGKAANTSIKGAILQTMGGINSQINLHADKRLDYCTTSYLMNRTDEYFIVAVVRRPWDRIVSFWRDKVKNWSRDNFSVHFIPGVYPDMPFSPFCECVLNYLTAPGTKPQKFLNYFQKFEERFIRAGVLLPEFVIDYDKLEQGWDKFLQHYPEFPKLPHYNKAAPASLGILPADEEDLKRQVYYAYLYEHNYFGWKMS